MFSLNHLCLNREIKQTLVWKLQFGGFLPHADRVRQVLVHVLVLDQVPVQFVGHQQRPRLYLWKIIILKILKSFIDLTFYTHSYYIAYKLSTWKSIFVMYPETLRLKCIKQNIQVLHVTIET